MSDYSTILATLQEEAHEPADSSVFARHVQRALRHIRSLVVPWSKATIDVELVSGQGEYERGVELPGDVLAFDSIFILYGGTPGGLNVELVRVTINEMRRLDISTTSAVGIPNYYAFYDDKLILWPKPGAASQSIRIDYQRDATRDENTGVEFSSASPDTAFTNEYFRRGEELLCSRALMTYAMGRSHSNDEATRARLLYTEALRSVLGERDLMDLDRNQVSRYF